MKIQVRISCGCLGKRKILADFGRFWQRGKFSFIGNLLKADKEPVVRLKSF